MINLECIESIAVVTLTRPSSLNALDCNAYRSLAAIFGDLEKNPNVRAVMLTGAPREDGRACFCAGADLRDGTLEEGSKLARIAFGLIERLPKPVIAAIGGVAVGGGLELALTCDLRVIARSSRLGVPEINIGSMPRAGGTQRLPALIGEAEAKKLLFSGDLIDGDEAFRIGLATQVVPDGEERSAAMALAQRLAAKAPLALAAIKRVVRDGRHLPHEAALDMEIEIGRSLDGTADRHEGRAAFLEKRTPRFTGK